MYHVILEEEDDFCPQQGSWFMFVCTILLINLGNAAVAKGKRESTERTIPTALASSTEYLVRDTMQCDRHSKNPSLPQTRRHK